MKFLEKSLNGLRSNPKHFSRMVIKGVCIGIFAGLVVCLYRFLLSSSESVLFTVIDLIRGNAYYIILWFALLIAMGFITGQLIKWQPLASGSGIPQINAEVKGYLNPKWWKILVAKTVGGTLSTLGGLSLGREGPSIQLGGMAGKGVSKLFRGSKTEEYQSIITGSAAGLAATFNAPLAGVIFSLEEINHNFDKTIIFIGLIAAIVADFISKLIFGQSTIFHFASATIPLNYYWLLIFLGIVLGFAGYVYNRGMIAGTDLFNKASNIPVHAKIIFAFVVAGVFSLFVPQVLAGGHSMIETLYISIPAFSVLVFLIIAKYILGLISFSSGAPGGIFFPLLVLGAYIGAAFGSLVIPYFGLPHDVIFKFIVISMAGFFTATVRAPITGVVLIAEMTGSTETLIATLIVSIIAYTIPTLLDNEPIYESLLNRILRNSSHSPVKSGGGQILKEYVVPYDSDLIGKKISEVPLANDSIIISLTRGEKNIIANSEVTIRFGDHLFILINSESYPYANKEIEFMIYRDRK